MRASFHTLGCRLNQADSASVADDLARHGFDIVPFGEPADVVVINSCSVTSSAAQRTRQTVHHARRMYPEAYLVVMGCDATVANPDGYRGANMVLPNPRPAPLSELLPKDLMPGLDMLTLKPGAAEEDFVCQGTGLFSEKTRANLKVQEGCNFFCSYCIVPYTRGRSRSRNLEDILREARELIARGHKEIVLSGVNVTTYDNSGCDLADLMKRLLDLGGDVRYRLGSAEPGPVIHKIVSLMSQTDRICRFLHLPLQYGEDSILKAMRRHYDTAKFREWVDEANSAIPGVCFGTDVIVGFPGETDETFEKCEEFLDSLPFGLMHVFSYSPRQGTPAATMPGRPNGRIVSARSDRLLAMAKAKAETLARSQVGQVLEVLTEEEEPPTGWSDNYLRVVIDGVERIPSNSLCRVRITGVGEERQVSGVLCGTDSEK